MALLLSLCFPLSLCCSHFPLSVFCERLLYEAPLMGLWGIYWTSVGDLTHCVCKRVCVRTYKSVCLLDCHVGSYITVLFHLCYCVHSHSKAIRFYMKSWSWELWSWEQCNRQAGILQSTSLCSWSLVQYRSQLQLRLHFHTQILTLLLNLFSPAHTCGTCVSGCMRGTDISELPQISACPTLFTPAVLWTLLKSSTHRLGVVFVPSGANRRQLWPLQHQWHSWLVSFSMLDLASLERMWLERHTEEMKWGVRGGDRRQLGFCKKGQKAKAVS